MATLGQAKVRKSSELGQAQERAPSGQVVVSHDFRELGSDNHTFRMPDPPVASDWQAPGLSAAGLLGTPLMPLCARSERPWSVHVGAVFDGDHGDPVQMIVDTVDHAVITTAGTVKPF
jgi:hypothetical protein